MIHSRHTLKEFDASLDELRAEVLAMGVNVSRSVEQAVSGLIQGNLDRCNEVIAEDEVVDTQEKQIDEIAMGIMVRFNPVRSSKDWILRPGDLLFMARGSRNFTVLIKDDLPDDVLAAACFFIIRISSRKILPEYLCWYLNQEPVARYLHQHTGQSVHMPVVKRAVLEGIDVQVPPLESQKMVSELAILMQKERMLLDLLAQKGRFCIISFHSLEDRIAKNQFRKLAKEHSYDERGLPLRDIKPRKIKIITKKPITPQPEEIRENPRARSAKMRVAEKL